MQGHGERPTAAFPSSHVGISTVILLASRKLSSTLTACLVPFYLLLCFSTVYIGAHYAIDALTGIPCGIAAFYFSAWLFRFRFSTASHIADVRFSEKRRTIICKKGQNAFKKQEKNKYFTFFSKMPFVGIR